MQETQEISTIQSEIVDEFDMFTDWMEKYEYLIDLGKSLPVIDEKYKVDENLIKGCQSRVWLHAEMNGDKVIYTADSDAILTKGIIALMVRVLSDHQPEEIVNADMSFIDEIGLKEHLSPTRANGLLSMIKQMKFYALAFQSKQEKS
ncbi:MAG: SufE family protein [Bacteroidota bacterium]|nr:SufE family protein [Bacteroidota bacterium]MDX5449318.1 SufE family protein [Bacteroidota bacterium]MDX5505140.1 SufE family protein [Bacteroidota bacterium]